MSENNDFHRYDDIIDLPHHQSATHPYMSMHDRAAQFAPFAALTGYGDAIAETARLTDERIELDEYEIAILDAQLQLIRENIAGHPVCSVTYFRPDDKKSGGAYLTKTGAVKKLNDFEKKLIFDDGISISISEIVYGQETYPSELFASFSCALWGLWEDHDKKETRQSHTGLQSHPLPTGSTTKMCETS